MFIVNLCGVIDFDNHYELSFRPNAMEKYSLADYTNDFTLKKMNQSNCVAFSSRHFDYD